MKKTIFSAIIASVLLVGTAAAQTCCADTAVMVVSSPRYVQRVVPLRRVVVPTPKVELVAKESKAFAVAAAPADPRVVRGLLRDRIVQPRRNVLSVVPVE